MLGQYVERANGDNLRARQAGLLRKQHGIWVAELDRLKSKILAERQRELEKEQAESARMVEGGAQPGGPELQMQNLKIQELMLSIEGKKIDMQQKVQDHQMKSQMLWESHERDKAIKDLETAAKIRTESL